MAIYGDGKHNENMEHIDKQDFGFYVDKKVTVWIREHHHIKAESYEAARNEMIEAFHDTTQLNVRRRLPPALPRSPPEQTRHQRAK
jgi:hypothetical protein